jgi:hypothetical protein
LFGAAAITDYPKDGINDHVITGASTVNPDQRGTKAAWWYQITVPAGGEAEMRLRLHRPDQIVSPTATAWSDQYFDEIMTSREHDADDFYAALAPDDIGEEKMRVLRQACGGLIWSKQIYPYRVARWLDGDPGQPVPPLGHRTGRNSDWRHFDSFDILAMPDPWEYPWFAAWDLAFHTISWAYLDPAFAKYQLLLLLREWFLHPNGALPAYEWSFDDVNPPVHALAAIRVFVIDGATDYEFLERVFQKLLLNFTWWLTARIRKVTTSLAAVSWDWTTSVPSIVPTCLPESSSTKQTEPHGWRTTRLRCSLSRRRWPSGIRSMTTWSSNS